MATGAGIIAMQADEFIEEEQPPQLSLGRIQGPAQTPFQGAFYPTGETLAVERLP